MNYICEGNHLRSISIAESDQDAAWSQCSTLCDNDVDCVQIVVTELNATHQQCAVYSESTQSSNTLPVSSTNSRCAYDAPSVTGRVTYSTRTTLRLYFLQFGPVNARLGHKLRVRPGTFDNEFVGTLEDVRYLDVGQISVNESDEVVSNHQRYVTIRGSGFDDTFPAYNQVEMYNRDESIPVLGSVVNSSRTHLILDVYQLSPLNEGVLVANVSHWLSATYGRLNNASIHNATCFNLNVTAPIVEASESILMSSTRNMTLRGM